MKNGAFSHFSTVPGMNFVQAWTLFMYLYSELFQPFMVFQQNHGMYECIYIQNHQFLTDM